MNSQDLENDSLQQITSAINKMQFGLKLDKSRVSYLPPDESEIITFKNIGQSNYQSSKPISSFNGFRSNVQSRSVNQQQYPYGNYMQQPLYQFSQFQNSTPMMNPSYITQPTNTMPINLSLQQPIQNIPTMISSNQNFAVRMNQTTPNDLLPRKSTSNDNNIPSNNKIVYKAQKSNESEILQRLSKLEAKVSQYQKKEASQNQTYNSIQTKCQQLTQIVQYRQNQIEQVKIQSSEIAKQVKNCNQLQSLYEQELKQYKVKMINIEKGQYNLKHQLGFSNGIPSLTSPVVQKKKIEVFARLSSAKSPESTNKYQRSPSRTNLTVLKNIRK